jgi:hypothetical protein
MATPAQILANQANAQLSTGPRTEEGRARSAANATKHGLSSAFRVLPHEDQDEFNDLLDKAREDHAPATEHQAFLVEQMVKTHWLLARAQRLEARAFEYLAGHLVADRDDPDSVIITKMFESNPNALMTLQRYAAQAEKSYYKAFRELKASKQIQNEADYISNMNSVMLRTMHSPKPGHAAASDDPKRTQYGFIPQFTNEAKKVREGIRGNSIPY